VPNNPGEAAAALLEVWGHLLTGVPEGWTRSEPGSLAAVTGVAIPTLNGVWVGSEDFDEEVVSRLLDQVASTGLPYCLQVRPTGADKAAGLATAYALTRDDHDIPLMVLGDLGHLGAAEGRDGLTIRELAPTEADAHARVAAEGFGAPLEAFRQLMTPSILAVSGVRCYLGEVGGQSVTTGLGVTLGSYVAIFNIATPPDHRRRGYGAAITARAAADGLAAGAKWAWLQASPAGYPVYQRLGFRTAEAWPCWLSTAADDS